MQKDNQSIGIYIIGDEILSGKRQDAHLSFVIQALKARGLQLAWAHYLGDTPAQITSLLQASMQHGDIVFSFGGIGATPDDYTRQCAADAAGVALTRHPGAVAEIEAQYGEGAYPKRVLMADLPAGAELIPNPVNRVAGFAINQHYFVPGFPQMAHPMVEWVLDTHYAGLFRRNAWCEQSVIVYGAMEATLTPLMEAIEARHAGVKVFSLPSVDHPQHGRHIELGVKGGPDLIPPAYAALLQGLSQLGAKLGPELVRKN